MRRSGQAQDTERYTTEELGIMVSDIHQPQLAIYLSSLDGDLSSLDGDNSPFQIFNLFL